MMKKVDYRPLPNTNLTICDKISAESSKKSMKYLADIEETWGLKGDAVEKMRNLLATDNDCKKLLAEDLVSNYSLYSDNKVARFTAYANMEIAYTKNFVEMVNNPVRGCVDGLIMNALKKTAFGRMKSIGVEQMTGKTFAEVENLVKKSARGNQKALEVLKQFSSDLMDDIRQNFLTIAWEMFNNGEFDIYCYHDDRKNDIIQFQKFYTLGEKEVEISKQLKKSVHKVSKHYETCCQMLFWDYDYSVKTGRYVSACMTRLYSSVQRYMRQQSSSHGKYQTMNNVETLDINGENVEYITNRYSDVYKMWQDSAQLDSAYIQEHGAFANKRQYALPNTFSVDAMVTIEAVESCLTENQRIVLGHMLNGLSIRDIAEVTGISVMSVRTCQSHIKKAFKELYFDTDSVNTHAPIDSETLEIIEKQRKYNEKYGHRIGQQRIFSDKIMTASAINDRMEHDELKTYIKTNAPKSRFSHASAINWHNLTETEEKTHKFSDAYYKAVEYLKKQGINVNIPR